MDPNTLDPKLKATYDRVMGTQTAPSTAAPATNPMIPPSTPPVSPVTNPVTPATPNPTAPAAPAYASDNLSFQAAIQAPVVGGTQAVGQAVIAPQRKTSPLLQVLYVILAIVFFAGYTYLWVKIFKLPIPFLN